MRWAFLIALWACQLHLVAQEAAAGQGLLFAWATEGNKYGGYLIINEDYETIYSYIKNENTPEIIVPQLPEGHHRKLAVRIELSSFKIKLSSTNTGYSFTFLRSGSLVTAEEVVTGLFADQSSGEYICVAEITAEQIVQATLLEKNDTYLRGVLPLKIVEEMISNRALAIKVNGERASSGSAGAGERPVSLNANGLDGSAATSVRTGRVKTG